jgi:hypothetical protein
VGESSSSNRRLGAIIVVGLFLIGGAVVALSYALNALLHYVFRLAEAGAGS